MMEQVRATAEQKRLLRDRGICVIIPTYNNAGTIADVVQRALAQCDDVIVVCDGCTDNTSAILSSMPVKADILDFPVNRGKGTALKEGFLYAKSKGFAYAITLDGDGQHFPEDIPILLEANIKHPGALLVGQRKGLEKMVRSKGSKFANAFSNFWFAVQTGQYLKDTQTGYRLYPLHKLYGLSLLTSRYEAELELMVFASWHGVKLVSVPVNVYYPPVEERVSHFRPGKDFARISVLNSVLCFLAVVYALPLYLLRTLMSVLRTLYSLLFFLVTSMLIVTPGIFLYLKTGRMTARKRENLHKIVQFCARSIMVTHGIPGVRYSQSNNSGETFEKPAVIICNHQSHLDLMPLLMQSHKMVVLANDRAYNNPFYGYLIHNAEFLPSSGGMAPIMPQLKDLVSRGYSIAIYPEGTRSKDCRIGRFHQGAFYLANELGLDILPVIVYGTGKVLPKHGRKLTKWPVHFEIDKRFSPAQMEEIAPDIKGRASYMRQYYIGRYADICNKIEKHV